MQDTLLTKAVFEVSLLLLYLFHLKTKVNNEVFHLYAFLMLIK